METKIIIFFPLEVGLAHIVRSLAIAEELQKRGNTIIFALPKRKWSIFTKSKIKFIDVYPCSEKENIEVVHIVKNNALLQKLAQKDLKLLEKYQPDCVIVDFRPSSIIAGIAAHIPTFCITGSLAQPYEHYLPDFFNVPLLHAVTSPLIQRSVSRAKKNFLINNLVKALNDIGNCITALELINKIIYLIPEEPFYLPLQRKRRNINYIGHLYWRGFDNYKMDWMENIKPDGKTVYLTFGGTGFNPLKLISLSSSLIKRGYRVIVSSSIITKPSDFIPHKNLFVAPFFPSEVLKHVDVVVCHGGYGTMIEAVLAKKPVLAIPFNPDQWTHALRFKEFGIGLYAINNPLQRFLTAISLDWNKFQELTSHIPEEYVLSQLKSIFKNYDLFQKNLRSFVDVIPQKKGSQRAADCIEKSLTNVNS